MKPDPNEMELAQYVLDARGSTPPINTKLDIIRLATAYLALAAQVERWAPTIEQMAHIARKLGYLVRDYPDDKQTREIIATIVAALDATISTAKAGQP